MHLSSLALTLFRSHRRSRIELNGRPVAIWGPNGAGKTNVLEAVSLLSPGRGLRGARAEELVRRPDGLGWKVAATLEGGGHVHEVETWAEPGEGRSVSIDGKPAPQVALGRIARILWLVPSMDRLWIEGADGRRRFLDRIALSFDPGHAEASLGYDKAMRERNRLLKDMVTDGAWYVALEAQMAETGARIAATRRQAIERIAQATEGAETAFPAATLGLTGPEGEDQPEDQDSLVRVYSDTRRRDLQAGRTLVGPHRADLTAVWAEKGVPAAQCSTGEQKALLISLILANARALKRDRADPPIVLLDEVAAHLDAGRRAALYDEIVALGAQALMTGTGPELFDDLGARAQRLELAETEGGSRVAPRDDA